MGIDKLGDKKSKKEHLKLMKKKKKNKSLNNDNLAEQKSPIEKKKRKHSAKNEAVVVSIEQNGEKKRRTISGKKKEKKKPDKTDLPAVAEKDDSENPKSERGGKKKKKDRKSLEAVHEQIQEESKTVADEVYQISGVDVDSSKGMKKWINEYHQSRPGVKILQQKIDNFITSHEEKEEQARKERDALAAEGGWTVVEHHKGRKKTTDAESGTTVGSVAEAAVADKLGKKKSKDVGVNFYRFQKREAHRNEIVMLQSKFEQDKKIIQQLRAARKFRPY